MTTRRRVAERTSPHKRWCVGARNSSSGLCVLNPSIERNAKFFTSHFCAAAKVIHRWLQRRERRSSSPPVNNFGGTISATVLSRRLVRCSRCGEGGSVAKADSVAVRRVSRRTSPSVRDGTTGEDVFGGTPNTARETHALLFSLLSSCILSFLGLRICVKYSIVK